MNTIKNKTLCFRASNEYDDTIAYCEWTPELRGLIKRRHEAVKALAATEERTSLLNHAEFFWYGLEVRQFEDDLEDVAPEFYEPYLVDMSDEEIERRAGDPVRIDLMMMCVSDKEVTFKFAIKHTNEYLEGGMVRLDDPNFFPREDAN